MSDRPHNDVDPQDAVSMAEEYLEHHREAVSSDRKRAHRERIEKWEERREELDEDDPLYRLAQERIDEQEAKLEELETGDADLERRLLSLVAEGFLAEGEWLDPRLLRALNLILFDKYSDSLVVQRHVLEEGVTFDGDELYAISRAVQRLAAEELESP